MNTLSLIINIIILIINILLDDLDILACNLFDINLIFISFFHKIKILY